MNLQTKRLRTEAIIFNNEWFLSLLLEYLNMKEIVTLDSSICSKSYREVWLKCIVKDTKSVSTKVEPYLNNDQSIEWCSKKNVKFRLLTLNYRTRPCSITNRGALLLATCCIDITEFQMRGNLKNNPRDQICEEIIIQIGLRCSK